MTVRTEITLDVACAWSYVGWVVFDRAARRHRDDGGRVEVRVVPHLLDPDASAPGTPLLPELRAAFGEQMQPQLDRVVAAGREVGIPFDYDAAVHANTVDAHALLRAAGADRVEDVLERLFRAQFVDGLDVSDPAVLGRVAEETGAPVPEDADRDAVRAELAAAPPVPAVPVFRLPDGRTWTGVPDEDELYRALREAGGS